ncbi:MAG: AAA family ATPase [Candidatus Magasanikbacteria bacterium]|nr:AAA family ATPase [Candidatus Magasanikbacteria bacterium]
MYLKSLELNGFKSFAQKTVLEFKGNKDGRESVTAIVGPNGAGKSNISDAIRWVMGETSLKALRGKKSQDIIFSGSESKGKMGASSVTMTLDNSDKKAPIEMEELVITRKLYRSGENEYYINAKRVRLLDLQLLLAKCQFGQGSYSVIGQGMIDRLLLQTPQERKQFFDEASGIKEFQIKRHQAILKLQRTKDNTEQAGILLNEITPRLKSLSRQVKKLEQRQAVDMELRETQEIYYSSLWTSNQEKINNLKQVLKGVDSEFTQSKENLTAIQKELAALAKAETRQVIFETLQQDYQTILKRKNEMEREKAVLQGKLQIEYSRAGKQNLGWLTNKIESLKQEEYSGLNDLKKIKKEKQEFLNNVQEIKNKLEEISSEKTEIKNAIIGLDQDITEARYEKTVSQFTNIRAVQVILEERHQFGTVYGAVAQLADVDEKYQLAMDVATGGSVASLVVDNDKTAQKAIEYLRVEKQGYATFLPLNKIKPRPISQNIEDFLGVEGVHGLAVDLADYDDKFSDIFSYVFGNTLIVEDMDIARKIGIGTVRMVTLDGDVMELSGSMKGGHRRKKQKGLSFGQGSSPYLTRNKADELEEKKKSLQVKLNKLEETEEAEQKKLYEMQSKFSAISSKEEILEAQKNKLSKELASLEQESSLHSLSKDDFNVAMNKVSQEKEDLDREIKKIDNQLKDIQNKINHFNKEEEEKKERIFALQDAMQAEQTQLNEVVDKRNEARVDLAKLETRQENLSNEVYAEMKISIDSIVEKNINIVSVDEARKFEEKIQKLKYKLSLIGGIDEEVVSEYGETKERHDELNDQLKDLEKAMKDTRELISELDLLMKKKRDKAFKQIRIEFKRYFELLFEGGSADIIELYGEEKDDEEDESEEEEKNIKKEKGQEKKILQGIDITACPPGKKIKNIQALSGGERTMTSIALVCAILHTNPSPFVVLDEVEAALDEANSLRFTKILRELAEQSQFIIITHNRATMHAADILYGVTMGNDGISKLLSVKVDEAEKISP